MTSNIIKQQSQDAKNAVLETILNTEQKNNILNKIKSNLNSSKKNILEENKKDIQLAKENNLSSSLIDRLTVTDATINSMIASLDKIINLDDPCGKLLETIKHQNGMTINKVSVPIGVIAIIYESRPNVTLDAAALCIKSGNAVILKGGKEAVNTNRIISKVINKSISDLDFNTDMVQFVDSTDRADTLELLKQDDYIDVVIPRGGTGLIKFINDNTKIPVLKHLHGICHTYIDKNSSVEMACKIAVNAKCQRPGVCNAMETLLIHREINQELFNKLFNLLLDNNVELRVCNKTMAIINSIDTIKNNSKIILASNDDWSTEYLDLILSVKIVDNLDNAIVHINNYGSHHSDCIITDDTNTADIFMSKIDSATVYHNASTRFTDGEEFGMGAEMGISTDKLHARGPVGLKELTIYKYKIYGSGQIK